MVDVGTGDRVVVVVKLAVGVIVAIGVCGAVTLAVGVLVAIDCG